MRESDYPPAACRRALLPLDDSARLEWRVWLAFQDIGRGPRADEILASRAASAVNRVTRLIEADISRTACRRASTRTWKAAARSR